MTNTICANCEAPLHFVQGQWCETQFSSPACRVVGGHTPKQVQVPGCDYPYCANPRQRDNVCAAHVNTNTHRRKLGLELVHRGYSGVQETFRLRMLAECSYWGDGYHIIPKTGVCRCGTAFAVMEFAP